jgi:hypothetical protein
LQKTSRLWNGNISQGTNLETEDEKKFALSGLFFRLNDKVNRWKNLLVSKREANNEALTRYLSGYYKLWYHSSVGRTWIMEKVICKLQ